MAQAVATYFLLFGWLSSLIAAIPPTRPTSISIISEDLVLNETHINPLNASQIIHYSIPQTQTVLVITTANSISRPAMHDILEDCISAAHTVMSKHGDVYMFPDPYLFKSSSTPELELRAYSLMVPGLKWTDLVNTLIGLQQVALLRALYKEMHIKIYDHPSGIEMGVLDLYKSSAIRPLDYAGIT